MTVGQRPTVQRRRLRSELRQRREAAGLTQDQVASRMDWSVSKLVRIEAGAVGISTNDLRALLDLYGVRAPDEVDDLVELARRSRQRAWWASYKGVLSPSYLEFIGLEADASTIRYFHPTIVPALLQTEAYARALISGGGTRVLEPAQVDSYVEIRMTRIREALGRPTPPDLVVVLDEAAIRRHVGGRAVMRQQLQHLVALAARPHVRLGVLPFSAGVHPGLYGSFALFGFTEPDADVVLYLEHAPGAMILRDRPGEVAEYEGAFDRILELALGPQQTVALLTEAADALG
ncbi:MAG: helix-turn-helix transcriptional regulator [Micromonosporaceae bacterium]